jgi:NADH-quinone oxidoreductase subunit G
MPDRVVWLPTHAQDCEIRRQLGAGHGTLVTLRSPQ